MEKHYTLVRGYGHAFCNSMEEVQKEIEKKLDEYKELNPTLINQTKSVYKTFFGKEVEEEVMREETWEFTGMKGKRVY